MLILSHRGYINGAAKGNHPDNIRRCLEQGFCVEIDLHWDGKKAFFGHDDLLYPVNLNEWDRREIIFHLKSPNLPFLKFADAFAIENDPFVVTLRGYIWANYGTPATSLSIVCAPELVGADEPLETFIHRNRYAAGICTDYPIKARKIIEQIENE